MLKHHSDLHTIIIVCSILLSWQYGIDPTPLVSPDNPCYMSVLEKYSLGCFEFIGGILSPLNGTQYNKTFSFDNTVKGMGNNGGLVLLRDFGHFIVSYGAYSISHTKQLKISINTKKYRLFIGLFWSNVNGYRETLPNVTSIYLVFHHKIFLKIPISTETGGENNFTFMATT